MSDSNLKLYSLGLVVEPKQRGSNQIKVTPIEKLPLQSGDMTQDRRSYQSAVPDATGVKRTSSMEGSNYVVATWIPNGQDNRMTAPDVQDGEQINIYRYADTDQYYWTTVFREPTLRRLETILWAACNIAAKSSAGADGNQHREGFDKDSSYWFEISTHDSKITIHTSTSNGEPFGYDVEIDAAIGRLTIKDTINNAIVLDSSTSTATVETNTEIILKSPKITIETTDLHIKGNTTIEGSVTSTGNIQASGTVHGSNI